MVIDPLDEKIGALRQEVAEARAKLVALETALRAYEDAARLRPSPIDARYRPIAAPVNRSDGPRRGGRQVGAISQAWREILRYVATQYPDGATSDAIASFGQANGLRN